MSRRTWVGVVEIDGQPVAGGTVTKYAHNTAKAAAVDVLRDHANGGYWHQTGAVKLPHETLIDFRHDDGREAHILIYPAA
jgi:hypothetical protein